MNELIVCATYDDNFEPMCAHFCSSLAGGLIKVRLNKLDSDGEISSFGSKTWYRNLSEKMKFLESHMLDLADEEIICCSDTDIQFFKPNHLLKMVKFMNCCDIEYLGQREHTSDVFNGGFFLIKKNEKTMDFVRRINSRNLMDYYYAEQELINEFIESMEIKADFLDPHLYLHGCMCNRPEYKISKRVVMHHATCAFNLKQKMEQMNSVRSDIGMEPVCWDDFMGHKAY